MRQVYVKHTCKKLEWIDFTFHSLEQFNAPRDVMPRGLKYNDKRSECKKKSTNTNNKSTA